MKALWIFTAVMFFISGCGKKGDAKNPSETPRNEPSQMKAPPPEKTTKKPAKKKTKDPVEKKTPIVKSTEKTMVPAEKITKLKPVTAHVPKKCVFKGLKYMDPEKLCAYVKKETFGVFTYLPTVQESMKKMKNQKPKKSKPKYEDDRRETTQDWDYPGYSFYYYLKKGKPNYLNSYYITKTFKGKTGCGIKIGSTPAEVLGSYGNVMDKDNRSNLESGDSESLIVVGDHYCGFLIVIKEGKVVSIRVGPTAL
ncbi:hypothetical protein KKF34_02870 [Myxococcota bacterium]|nr:hypothetical protein [Myxococcota bacterium]MBU1382587.1 hypothetical protein [Myxococcota bacterium]MBU1495804.1 hypothetical protein [Myxococcota bacterium]